MNKKVKKLVELSFVDGKIDNKIAEYILTNLSKKELKEYVRILKSRIEQNRVIISSASPISAPEKKKMSKFFPEYSVEFEEDKQNGGGIKVAIGDTIIDLSVNNYINTILANLK